MRDTFGSGQYGKNRTITMTFRVEKKIMASLRTEAARRGVSLNMLVNQVFKNFMDWHVFETKIGMVPMPKSIILELFRNLSKEEIIDLATRIGKNEIYDIALFMKSKVDVDSFIEWICIRMRNSSMHITHRVNVNSHVYTIKHDLSLNWSLYHKVTLELIFENIIGKDVEIDISEKSFTIRFEN
jgi:hypothetical protein